ncbi:MAG TPA: helix-turn-helix domain-containing protein [Sunxiuqinia sp.]|nr:helix-turn-helix domain-containing protein [Sunxiuqinia sp.]
MNDQKKAIPVYSEAESFHEDFYKDFNISSYKDDSREDLNRLEPHRHTYYEIIWITKGYGTHLIDFQVYDFKGPCLFILNPGVVHKIVKDIPTEGYVVKFSESFLLEEDLGGNELLRYGLFDNIHVRPIFQLDGKAVSLLDDLMKKMLEEFNVHQEVSRAILLSYLKVYLLQVYKLREDDSFNENKTSPRYQTLLNFKRLVEQNFTKEKNLDFYSEKLATSKRNLNDITNTFLGEPASALLKKRIILEAKRLLFSGEVAIKEIGYILGYDDPAYFTRFFTKNEGMSPTEFLQEK